MTDHSKTCERCVCKPVCRHVSSSGEIGSSGPCGPGLPHFRAEGAEPHCGDCDEGEDCEGRTWLGDEESACDGFRSAADADTGRLTGEGAVRANLVEEEMRGVCDVGYINGTFATFINSLRVCIEEQARNPMCDNAVLSVLINAARCAWELDEMVRQGRHLGLPDEPRPSPTSDADTGSEGEDGAEIHHLKCWPRYFADVRDGRKTFEIRYNDRDYKVGDTLILQEYLPEAETMTGEYTCVDVLAIWDLCDLGWDDYVAMQVIRTDEPRPSPTSDAAGDTCGECALHTADNCPRTRSRDGEAFYYPPPAATACEHFRPAPSPCKPDAETAPPSAESGKAGCQVRSCALNLNGSCSVCFADRENYECLRYLVRRVRALESESCVLPGGLNTRADLAALTERVERLETNVRMLDAEGYDIPLKIEPRISAAEKAIREVAGIVAEVAKWSQPLTAMGASVRLDHEQAAARRIAGGDHED